MFTYTARHEHVWAPARVTRTHWHLRITLESSAKERVKALAETDRRSASNYVRLLIEDALTARSSA